MKRKDLNAPPPAKLRFIEPMYARLVKELPEGPAWEYEIKFDGYRCLAGRKERGVVLWSRRGNGLTHQFPEIALGCERLKRDTVVDGEIIAIDENGRVSFNLLQNHRSGAAAIQFFAFDLVMCEGKSLLHVTLELRRKLLAKTLKQFGPDTPIRFSETVEVAPDKLIACREKWGSRVL